MAQYTLSSNSFVRPYRSAKGSPAIRNIQGSTYAAGGGIRIGDVVQQDTNTASNSFRAVRMANHIPSTAIWGVASANDPQDGSTGPAGLGSPTSLRIPVWLAERDTEFIAFSKDSALDPATAVGNLGVIKRDSTLNIWYVSTTASTAGDVRVRITQVPDPNSTNGAYVFRFLSTALVLTD